MRVLVGITTLNRPVDSNACSPITTTEVGINTPSIELAPNFESIDGISWVFERIKTQILLPKKE